MMTKQISCQHFWQKKLGAKKTIIIVNNYTYINILPKNFVDIALSPQRLTVSMVLQHLAKGRCSSGSYI